MTVKTPNAEPYKSTQTPPRPAVLCILDGWGHRSDSADNAIAQGRTPVWDRLWSEAPRGFLQTSGLAVGLPEGQMGNSEVGHMNIGAGRVVMQDLPRIDAAIAGGSFAANKTLLSVAKSTKAAGGTVHVMGLLSPGGVHSHQRHMAETVRVLAAEGVTVRIHAFLDGRDTPPKSALGFLETFLDDIAGVPGASIATVSGRYFAMDRDKNWERTALAYAALVEGEGPAAQDAKAAVEASYAADVTDEFVKPSVIDGYTGMADSDGLVMINFRADRARQILTALLDPQFDGFTARRPDFAAVAGMVEYSSHLADLLPAIFPPEDLVNTLGEAVAKAGRTQLRIAETEKYAHVTFFLNGGRETVFEGEERILVPSPKVATYDLQPEMSAPEVTDKLTGAIRSGKFDLIVINFANPDMVGHTGSLPAAVKAVETVDTCLGQVEDAVKDAGGVMLVTADHGNVEMMKDPETGNPHTAHTTFDVPVVLANAQVLGAPVHLAAGKLADLAPTMLALMGLDQPAEMTGQPIVRLGAAAETEREGERLRAHG